MDLKNVFFDKVGRPIDYHQYALDNNIYDLIGFDDEYVSDKHNYDYAVDENYDQQLPVQIEDLIRIHFLIRKFKVITALEFGSGKSTIVIADALMRNRNEYKDFVSKNLRKNNKFELHTVETSDIWAKKTSLQIPEKLKLIVNFSVTDVNMSVVNSKICTLYDDLPNITPDFIYLDGPDQYAPLNSINGISTSHPDRLPMVADLVRIEYFLLPGTVILVDGRTSNSMFMLNNFQQDWSYKHYEDQDISIFYNNSKPLGNYNKAELKFKFSQE